MTIFVYYGARKAVLIQSLALQLSLPHPHDPVL